MSLAAFTFHAGSRLLGRRGANDSDSTATTCWVRFAGGEIERSCFGETIPLFILLGLEAVISRLSWKGMFGAIGALLQKMPRSQLLPFSRVPFLSFYPLDNYIYLPGTCTEPPAYELSMLIAPRASLLSCYSHCSVSSHLLLPSQLLSANSIACNPVIMHRGVLPWAEYSILSRALLLLCPF